MTTTERPLTKAEKRDASGALLGMAIVATGVAWKYGAPEAVITIGAIILGWALTKIAIKMIKGRANHDA